MDEVIKIVEPLEKSGLLIDGACETVQHQIKNQGRFLPAMMAPMAASLTAPMASSLIKPAASSLINAITGKEFRRAGKGQVTRARRGYNKMDQVDKNFHLHFIF